MYFFPDVPVCKVVQMNSWQLQGKESEQEIPGHGDYQGKHLRDYRDGVSLVKVKALAADGLSACATVLSSSASVESPELVEQCSTM